MDSRDMARKRWQGMTAEERRAAMPDPSEAGRAAWAKLSPEERSEEMKRRAKKRVRRNDSS